MDGSGQEIRFPNLTCKGESRTTRCAATNVDPQTGQRDMAIPAALDSLYGHMDFGIYLIAKSAGTIAVGDRVEISTLVTAGAGS